MQSAKVYLSGKLGLISGSIFVLASLSLRRHDLSLYIALLVAIFFSCRKGDLSGIIKTFLVWKISQLKKHKLSYVPTMEIWFGILLPLWPLNRVSEP